MKMIFNWSKEISNLSNSNFEWIHSVYVINVIAFFLSSKGLKSGIIRDVSFMYTAFYMWKVLRQSTSFVRG